MLPGQIQSPFNNLHRSYVNGKIENIVFYNDIFCRWSLIDYMQKSYEIRDPVHGFIKISEWERDIINHSAFQRLRRIKQLAWTDMVYPGASHSRLEHSLGVMHVVSNLFDSIAERQKDFLGRLGYNSSGLDRLRSLIRLAALLHDIGHSPFSHAGEGIFPVCIDTGQKYEHEEYSAAIVKFELRDVIENNQFNRTNFRITADDVAGFFVGSPSLDCLLWRDLLTSQMDGDRMDYLLRDAYHAGVNYGKYDLNRLIATIRLIERPETPESTGGYSLGIDEDGVHAAEGLILARYMMFTQLYFHKTRVAYDYHLVEAIREVLMPHGGTFPQPNSREAVQEYLNWDDWRVLGAIAEGKGGEHGEILKQRNHYRRLRETPEVPSIDDLEWIDGLLQELKILGAVRRDAGKSWYKFHQVNDEILVLKESGRRRGKSVAPLSQLSPVVKGLKSVKQSRIYIPEGNRKEAEKVAERFDKEGESV